MTKPKGKYAWTVKIGEKGQLVIPKEAREMFDINPGDTIIILGDEKRGIAIPPKNVFTKLVSNLFENETEVDGENVTDAVNKDINEKANSNKND